MCRIHDQPFKPQRRTKYVVGIRTHIKTTTYRRWGKPKLLSHDKLAWARWHGLCAGSASGYKNTEISQTWCRDLASPKPHLNHKYEKTEILAINKSGEVVFMWILREPEMLKIGVDVE
jgi:hypothetical protein